MATKTISTSAEEILPQNRLRKSWIIQNEDTTDAVFLKRVRGTSLTVSSTDHDHRLGPGASLAFSSLLDGKEEIQDRWIGVSSANTPRISFIETEDVTR